MIRQKLINKVVIGAIIALLTSTGYAQPISLSQKLRQAIKGVNAQIGIAVIIDGKDTIAINDSLRYPMLSVYKFHQALAVMDYLNYHNLSPDTKLHVTAADLKPDTYSPLRDKYPAENINISVTDLLKYTLQQSDNNACDILFQYIGGVKVVDHYIRSLGIKNFSISATEDDMHRDVKESYNNWTTPLEAAKLLEVFLHKTLFPKAYQSCIYQTMIECQTGKDRLSKPLTDKEIIIGHKTGSSDKNSNGQIIGTNDIGFVILPDGHYYSIAVFVKDSSEESKTNEQIIATVSSIVYEYIVGLR